MLTHGILAQAGSSAFVGQSSAVPTRYEPAISSLQDSGSSNSGYAGNVPNPPPASYQSTPVSTQRTAPAADIYSGNNLQTSESVAAEARQFASALAASFSGMDVGAGEQSSAPVQPVTPQQVSVQQEEEWAQPAAPYLPEATELQDYTNSYTVSRSGSFQVRYPSMG